LFFGVGDNSGGSGESANAIAGGFQMVPNQAQNIGAAPLESALLTTATALLPPAAP